MPASGQDRGIADREMFPWNLQPIARRLEIDARIDDTVTRSDDQ